jgi:hypothetical protein
MPATHRHQPTFIDKGRPAWQNRVMNPSDLIIAAIEGARARRTEEENSFAARLLPPPKRTRGAPNKIHRDIEIISAVRALRDKLKIPATRNEATAFESAISLVAKLLAHKEKTVGEIWRIFRRWERLPPHLKEYPQLKKFPQPLPGETEPDYEIRCVEFEASDEVRFDAWLTDLMRSYSAAYPDESSTDQRRNLFKMFEYSRVLNNSKNFQV